MSGPVCRQIDCKTINPVRKVTVAESRFGHREYPGHTVGTVYCRSWGGKQGSDTADVRIDKIGEIHLPAGSCEQQQDDKIFFHGLGDH